MSIEKARKIVAAIEDANDRAHGAATAWCPDEAVELIAAALSAAHAEPVAARSSFGPGSRLADVMTMGTGRQSHVASPPSEASRDERAAIRKEAFEEAAAIAKIEAEQCASLGCSHPENSQNRDRLFARARSAEAIATAIRARGER